MSGYIGYGLGPIGAALQHSSDVIAQMYMQKQQMDARNKMLKQQIKMQQNRLDEAHAYHNQLIDAKNRATQEQAVKTILTAGQRGQGLLNQETANTEKVRHDQAMEKTATSRATTAANSAAERKRHNQQWEALYSDRTKEMQKAAANKTFTINGKTYKGTELTSYIKLVTSQAANAAANWRTGLGSLAPSSPDLPKLKQQFDSANAALSDVAAQLGVKIDLPTVHSSPIAVKGVTPNQYGQVVTKGGKHYRISADGTSAVELTTPGK